MNRPYLVNFSAIASNHQLSIRAMVAESVKKENNDNKLHRPIDNLGLFRKKIFKIKIMAMSREANQVFIEEYDSDNFGIFRIVFPFKFNQDEITKINVYETSSYQGISIHLGAFIPINKTKKVVISDFDKTLVDTRYSNLKEVYFSLNKPLNFFPSIDKSIDLLKGYIKEDYTPFILSASPHFYESAIRDWLYQNQIFVSNILLKDYRSFFTLFDSSLSVKDFKKQGFYKLNQLINTLLMTKIPEELVLMGDGFESDPYIYIALKQLLTPHSDPWKLWKSLKNHHFFGLTGKQDSAFITKFNQISEMAKHSTPCKVTIHIRTSKDQIDLLKNQAFQSKTLSEINKGIDYYLA